MFIHFSTTLECDRWTDIQTFSTQCTLLSPAEAVHVGDSSGVVTHLANSSQPAMPFSLNVSTALSPTVASASSPSAQKENFTALEDDTRTVGFLTPEAYIYVQTHKMHSSDRIQTTPDVSPDRIHTTPDISPDRIPTTRDFHQTGSRQPLTFHQTGSQQPVIFTSPDPNDP